MEGFGAVWSRRKATEGHAGPIPGLCMMKFNLLHQMTAMTST